MGFNERSGDPQCVYLLFNGILFSATNFLTNEVTPIAPYKAAITGGSGKYLLAEGEALIARDLDSIENIDIDLAYVRNPLANVRNGQAKLWSEADFTSA
mmetsp:Transcript_19164/g.44519  ORF Transcript_19164/g.44519 Transcript_19164/m.44519 type:complete len:99 (-) Transcript_19164:104-400(-)